MIIGYDRYSQVLLFKYILQVNWHRRYTLGLYDAIVRRNSESRDTENIGLENARLRFLALLLCGSSFIFQSCICHRRLTCPWIS